jgi:hypothetical protein
MTAASYAPDPETARKNLALILKRVGSAGGVHIAAALGIDDSLISKAKSPQNGAKYSVFELVASLMAYCGLKVVPIEKECYTPQYMHSLRYLAGLRLNDPNAPTDDDPE